MKRVYTTPVVAFEAYSLTSQIAGACADAGKTPIGKVDPITIKGTRVHCVMADTNTPKNCSPGAHTWEVSLDGTIFADGNKENGCTHDVYTQADYAALLARSMAGGSTVSGKICSEGTHFCFKGESHEHTGSFAVADYSNYFQS
ncbi:hypothetical protein [Faecalicatena contorta]|uniref:hypothetical protein n=1 Tax=Faecalicatena contorta TaxID=39482 RepID=UPI001F1A721C|nr:hypothetical protein [Faecalicatena contorta]MCF2682341.1 hypothetical protein [Faecalicatena contorta]